MEKKVPLFIKNLEYIRSDVLHITPDQFCGRKKSAEAYQKKGGATIRQLKEDGVLTISPTTYGNYVDGKTMPNDTKRIQIVNELNDLRRYHSVLPRLFPDDLTVEQLFNTDLTENNKRTLNLLYDEKFIGDYICYYLSTNAEGSKQIQTGVLALRRGPRSNEYAAEGVFSLEKESDATKILERIGNGSPLKSICQEGPSLIFFSGSAYLSTSHLQCNLSDEEKKEHASFAFDFSSKVTTKHRDKPFIGAIGIALSQSSGQSSRTAVFPFIILRKPPCMGVNELEKYLHFDYSPIEENEFDKASETVINLMESLFTNELFDKALIASLVKSTNEHEIKRLLQKHKFGCLSFTPEQLEDFYKTVIKPMRDE